MKKLPKFLSPKMNQVRQTRDEYLEIISYVLNGAACSALQRLKPSFSRCFDLAAEAAAHKTHLWLPADPSKIPLTLASLLFLLQRLRGELRGVQPGIQMNLINRQDRFRALE